MRRPRHRGRPPRWTGWVFTLPDTVLFDYNKTAIKPDAAAKLEAVADALAATNVAASRMTIKGFGPTPPITPNNADAGRAKNRHVEMVLRDLA